MRHNFTLSSYFMLSLFKFCTFVDFTDKMFRFKTNKTYIYINL